MIQANAPQMSYSEIKPSRSLAKHVDCFWYFSNPGVETVSFPVLPDNCMDIIFDLNEKKSFICGVMTKARIVKIKPKQKMFGIRFAPGALPAALNEPAAKFRDLYMPLEEVSKRLADEFSGIYELDSALDMGLYCGTALEGTVQKIDRENRIANFAASRHSAKQTVANLAMLAGVSVRQLERLFWEYVGLTPKRFMKIKRLRFLQKAMVDEKESLASLSIQAGYADQSHMNKDYKQLTSTSPARSRMSRFYKKR